MRRVCHWISTCNGDSLRSSLVANTVLVAVSLGLVEVRRGEEPADAIYDFLAEVDIEDEDLRGRAHRFLVEHACRTVPCTRLEAVVWSEEIQLEDDTYIGAVSVFAGREPVDDIDRFVKHHGLDPAYRDTILVQCCEDIECTRDKPLIYSKDVSNEHGQPIGTVEILEEDEVVDTVVKFVIDNEVNLDIIALKNYFFQEACGRPGAVCTR